MAGVADFAEVAEVAEVAYGTEVAEAAEGLAWEGQELGGVGMGKE